MEANKAGLFEEGAVSQTGIVDGVSVKSDQTFSSEESMRAVSTETSQNKVSYLQALKRGTHKRTQSDSIRLTSPSSSSSLHSDKKENEPPVDMNSKDSSIHSKKADLQVEQEGDNMRSNSKTPDQDDPEIMEDNNSDGDTVIITSSEADALNICQPDDGQNSVSLNPEADEFTLPQHYKERSLNPDANEFTLKQNDKNGAVRQTTGNGVFLPKSSSFQYPPPLPIAYDQTIFPLPSSKGSSSGYETPNSVETQDTFVYPDSQSTDTYTKYPSSSTRSQRFRTPPPSPMRLRSPSAPQLQAYPYPPNAAYVQNVPNVPFQQVAYRQPYKVPYAVPQPYGQYPAYPGQYPVYVKHAQYVPNAQYYGQVPAQYVVQYPPPPQYASVVNMRVPHGYVPAHAAHVVPDTCAIQCGVQCMDMAHMQGMGGASYASYASAQYPRRMYNVRDYNKRRGHVMTMAQAPPPPPPPAPKEEKEHVQNAEHVVNADHVDRVQEDLEQYQVPVTQDDVDDKQEDMQEMQEMQEMQTDNKQIEELSVEHQQCDQKSDQ